MHSRYSTAARLPFALPPGADPDISNIYNIRTGECQISWLEIVYCKQWTSQHLQRFFSYIKTIEIIGLESSLCHVIGVHYVKSKW